MNRNEEISQNLNAVSERVMRAAEIAERDPGDITLVVVSKNFPVSDAQVLYDLGVRHLGENRDQEGALKSEQLPADTIWHFQGEIQGRKIKSIASWADCIHSLDSLDHARKFDGAEHLSSSGTGRNKEFFVQVNLEPQRVDRGGVPIAELDEFLHILFSETRLAPIGLMTVAPQNMEPTKAFSKLQELRDDRVTKYPSLAGLSMGMSGDFEAAFLCGATHIRVGSSILGSRGLAV